MASCGRRALTGRYGFRASPWTPSGKGSRSSRSSSTIGSVTGRIELGVRDSW